MFYVLLCIQDVRLGSPDNSSQVSVDLEEGMPPLVISGSPPSSLIITTEKKITPPSSPNMSSTINIQSK